MVSSQIFNIRILILSCRCALFELTFWITLTTSSVENVTEDRRLPVSWLRFVKSLLLLLIIKHWFENKSLNGSGLCCKSEVKRLLSKNGGISGIFWLFKNIFSKGQILKLFCILQLTSHFIIVFFFWGFDGVI